MFYSLQNWRVYIIPMDHDFLHMNQPILSCESELYYIYFQGIFERFDMDRSGKIDAYELREALLSLGFSVSPIVLELLVSKYDKSSGIYKAVEYDNFIEYIFFKSLCFLIIFYLILLYLTFD